jgi:hypothetical protein
MGEVFQATRCQSVQVHMDLLQMLETLEFLNEHPTTKMFQWSFKRLVEVINW